MALFRCGGGSTVKYDLLTLAGISAGGAGVSITWASLSAAGFNHCYIMFGGGFSAGIRAGVIIEVDVSAQTATIKDHDEVVAAPLTVGTDSTGISITSSSNFGGAYFCFA